MGFIRGLLDFLSDSCFWSGHSIINYDKKTRVGYCKNCGLRLRLNRDASYPHWTPISEFEPDFGDTYEYGKRELNAMHKVQKFKEIIPNMLKGFNPKRQKTQEKANRTWNEIIGKLNTFNPRNPYQMREIAKDMQSLYNRLKANNHINH